MVVTTNDRTIDGVSITSSGTTGVAISAVGSAANPIRNLTIRNCSIKGFDTAIEVRYVVNLVIENCLIQDARYGGIMVFSGTGGRISGNTIQRIGYQTAPAVAVNAYGIALSRVGTSNLTAEPPTSNFTVSGNIVEDVPTWHGLDTHAGRNITWSNNVVRRCMRPFFITGGNGINPIDNVLSNNRIESAKSFTGSGSLAAITLVNLQGGAVTNNAVSSTYPRPFVYDYLGNDPAGSVGVTISGQTVIP